MANVHTSGQMGKGLTHCLHSSLATWQRRQETSGHSDTDQGWTGGTHRDRARRQSQAERLYTNTVDCRDHTVMYGPRFTEDSGLLDTAVDPVSCRGLTEKRNLSQW